MRRVGREGEIGGAKELERSKMWRRRYCDSVGRTEDPSWRACGSILPLQWSAALTSAIRAWGCRGVEVDAIGAAEVSDPRDESVGYTALVNTDRH